jgi:hypothetical protein
MGQPKFFYFEKEEEATLIGPLSTFLTLDPPQNTGTKVFLFGAPL